MTKVHRFILILIDSYVYIIGENGQNSSFQDEMDEESSLLSTRVLPVFTVFWTVGLCSAIFAVWTSLCPSFTLKLWKFLVSMPCTSLRTHKYGSPSLYLWFDTTPMFGVIRLSLPLGAPPFVPCLVAPLVGLRTSHLWTATRSTDHAFLGLIVMGR